MVWGRLLTLLILMVLGPEPTSAQIFPGHALPFEKNTRNPAFKSQPAPSKIKDDCFQQLSPEDYKAIAALEESLLKLSALRDTEQYKAQVSKLLDLELPKLSRQAQTAVVAITTRNLLLRLFDSIRRDEALAKAYNAFDDSLKEMENLKDGSGTWDHLFGKTRYEKALSKLEVAEKALVRSVKTSAHLSEGEKRAFVRQILETEQQYLRLADHGLQKDQARTNRAVAVDTVVLAGSVSAGLIIGAYLTGGALSAAAAKSTAATGAALTAVTAATTTGQVTVQAATAASLSAGAAVLKTAAIGTSLGAMGGGGVVGLTKTVQMLGNAQVEAHFNNESYFCSLAREVESQGPNVAKNMLVGAAFGGAIGGFLSLVPPATTVGLYALGMSPAAAMSAAQLASLGFSGTLLAGGVGASFWMVHADAKRITAELDLAQQAAEAGDERKSRVHLLAAEKAAVSAGVNAVASAIGGLLSARGFESYRKGLRQAWDEVLPLIRTMRQPTFAPSPNGDIALITPTHLDRLPKGTVVFDHTGDARRIGIDRISKEAGPFSREHTRWGLPPPVRPDDLALKFSPPKNFKFAPKAELASTDRNGHATHTLMRLRPQQIRELPDGTVLVSADGERVTKGYNYISLLTDDGFTAYGFVKAGTGRLPPYNPERLSGTATITGLKIRNLPPDEVTAMRNQALREVERVDLKIEALASDGQKLRAAGRHVEATEKSHEAFSKSFERQYWSEMVQVIDEPWRFFSAGNRVAFLYDGNEIPGRFPSLESPFQRSPGPPSPAPARLNRQPVLVPAGN